MTVKLGELFCGPGGIAVGATLTKINGFKIEHTWATDYHSDTCDTYRKNIFPNNPEKVVCHDIRSLNMDVLGKISEVDALAFGFPCNDFSLVGEQKGVEGEFGPLYTYCVKAINRFKPKWFLAENVGGLRSSNNGKAFDSILNEFRDCGYTLYPHLYKFEKYGVPQARHRIIIIGIRHDLEIEFKVPASTGITKTAKSALANIPKGATNQVMTKQSRIVVERLMNIEPGQNAFNADLPEHLKLNVKGAKISQIYKRLDPDRPAYTVTGSGGGGTHMYHWKEPRALTNRERARLQTFPDDFEFCGSKESVRRQIGMAVPADGIRQIFEALLMSFAGVSYPSEEPSFGILRYDPEYKLAEGEKLKLVEEVAIYEKEIS
ncbi:MAG: DNA (cytosine-5-)-methyltransferase [Bacteroidetes bacterium]|nr:DNA (cytosine-5-)-methyltransferase [Bacteroidota bacterium]